MFPVVRVKEGVTFAAIIGAYKGTIAPAGFVLLGALVKATHDIGHDLTITSGSDGCHSGETDPHHSGEAYDVRTHDLTNEQKQLALDTISREAGPLFYAFLEAGGTENEHIHCQRARNTIYPPADGNNHDAVAETHDA